MDPTELAAELRAWGAFGTASVQAAVELLIWKRWHQRAGFQQAAIMTSDGITAVRWPQARLFCDLLGKGGAGAPRASSSEATILDIAVCLGENRFRLGGLGSAHQLAVVAAFATACGLPSLVPVFEPPPGERITDG